MRTIIHASDIHFSRIDQDALDAFIDEAIALRPDLVIISGDITQRSRKYEFESAVLFLKKLSSAGLKLFIIPGNHDIAPAYRPFDRLLGPFERYRRYISPDIEPRYMDEEIAVAGVNTVRKTRLVEGDLDAGQLNEAARWFGGAPKNAVKIIVTHHPLDLPASASRKRIASHALIALRILSKYAVDVYLSGHLHMTSVVRTAERYFIDGYSAVAIQAGTMSLRSRGEEQSFNIIRIERPNLSVETLVWDRDKKQFSSAGTKSFSI